MLKAPVWVIKQRCGHCGSDRYLSLGGMSLVMVSKQIDALSYGQRAGAVDESSRHKGSRVVKLKPRGHVEGDDGRVGGNGAAAGGQSAGATPGS